MEPTAAEKLLSDAAERAQTLVDKADLVAQALLRANERSDTKIAEQVAVALRQVFSTPDDQDPEHMKIIYSKIPILCIRVDAMDENLQSMKESLVEQKQSLAEQKSMMQKQASDMVWMKWLGGGFVGAAGLLALKSLGL